MQIADDLSFFSGREPIQCLQLDDDITEAKKISAIADVEALPAVVHREFHLACINDSLAGKLKRKAPSWYTASRKPCPSSRCTAIAAPIMANVCGSLFNNSSSTDYADLRRREDKIPGSNLRRMAPIRPEQTVAFSASWVCNTSVT